MGDNVANEAPREHDQEAREARVGTLHEPHRHARPRVLWGVAAVALVAVGALVWARWGDTIRETCFGKDGACPVDQSNISEDGVHFERPTGFVQ